MWSLTGIKEHDQKPCSVPSSYSMHRGPPSRLLNPNLCPASRWTLEMARNSDDLRTRPHPLHGPAPPFQRPTFFLMAPGLLCLVTHPQLEFSWNPARRMLPHLLLENFSSMPDADGEPEAENWRFTQPTGRTS